MAIYRVGPAQDTVRTPLGGVLVTIDDLEGLMSLLSNLSSGGPSSPDVRVEFNGGYFTDPADLRKLSDVELKSLRVVTANSQAILSDSEALVIGSDDIGRSVYQEWARARTTSPRVRLRARRRAKLRLTKNALVVAGLIFVGFVVSGIVGTFLGSAASASFSFRGDANWGAGLSFGLLVLITSGVMYMRVIRQAPGSFAILVPLTLDEYRRNRDSNKLPRWNLVVAILSVLVAIVAIVVSVLIAR